ncbi:NAD(P)/FAD-dependent oxidoreductase [Miniphocaeibacter halophilus]|uniref:NAD(P)/FAD-dependent oxidoreductase n=1 Tax=Miniphocaeibacter halophilus TaxID=2931922 RepID=A0AC61MQ07_9FIRM|nr:NAD(P)/FAD-dependent oxidoreductase [Miniphocaeibacter halophilus]QQK07562.1 NAD(P)/FAD-dependent oxidoreductase [Miniphocaeibacter halophilus]
MKNVVVIGAGPAGILAAIAAKTINNNVLILEKNEKIGKKLYITGKGRCNITNYSPIEDFFPMINSNSKFMYSALYNYTNMDILNLLESYGLKYKVERGNRVFPYSDKSSDVIKTFNKILLDLNIKVKLNEDIRYIEKQDDVFRIYGKTNKYESDFLVIATGGISYPATGSTGAGHKFAKNFGHSVTKLNPSLVPMEIKSNYLKELQGVSLKNIELAVKVDDNIICKEFGELVFTHFGLSGPIVLKASNSVPENKNNIIISIDLKPKLDLETLDNRIQRDFAKYSNKNIENALDDLLIKKLIPVVLKESKINCFKKVNQITREERLRLINTIKNLKFELVGLRPIKEAIITKGGISVREINPKTMESKKIENLYFAGEVIDIDAMTGGYNLQIAYSTGYAAGKSIKEKSNE